jgi:hypothetical protein
MADEETTEPTPEPPARVTRNVVLGITTSQAVDVTKGATVNVDFPANISVTAMAPRIAAGDPPSPTEEGSLPAGSLEPGSMTPQETVALSARGTGAFEPIGPPPTRTPDLAVRGPHGPADIDPPPRGAAALSGVGAMSADAILAPGPIRLHQEMLSRIAVLERMMAELRGPQQPGIGHNNPPETIEGVSFGDDDHQAVDQAILLLKAQAPVPTAPAEARNAAAILQAIGERLWAHLARAGGYAAKQADVFITEAVKAAGTEAGKRLVQMPFWWALASSLLALAASVNSWLGSLH